LQPFFTSCHPSAEALLLTLLEKKITMTKIVNREIFVGKAPFIIAEMTSNHNQPLERTPDA
jgi:hypothetical protein